MNEEVAAANWLLGYLEADSELGGTVGTFRLRSTADTDPLPYVKIDVLDRSDLMINNAKRVWNDMTFLVRGVTWHNSDDDPDWSQVQDISDRIDTLIHRLQGAAGDGIYVQEVFREESFSDETNERGRLFLHAGGVYRLRVQAT